MCRMFKLTLFLISIATSQALFWFSFFIMNYVAALLCPRILMWSFHLQSHNGHWHQNVMSPGLPYHWHWICLVYRTCVSIFNIWSFRNDETIIHLITSSWTSPSTVTWSSALPSLSWPGLRSPWWGTTHPQNGQAPVDQNHRSAFPSRWRFWCTSTWIYAPSGWRCRCWGKSAPQQVKVSFTC